jgi:hypothetical protein
MSDKIKGLIDAFGMGFGCLLIAGLGIIGFGTILGAIILTVWQSL